MSDLTPAPGEILALLGAGSRYEGKLTFEGRARIDGSFEGQIFSGDTLIIGDGAEIRGDIRVGTLIVLGGELWGEVHATELVELHAKSVVHGDIETPQLFIDKGAVFEGKCQMNGAPAERHSLDGAVATALEGSAERPLPSDSSDEGAALDSDTEEADLPSDDDSARSEEE